MRTEWEIETYEDITYWHWGRENCFNLLNDNSILQPWELSEIPREIEQLVLNLSSWDIRNVEYIHKIVLYKYLNPNSSLLPALIFHWAWATWKGTFLTLLSTIFGEKNVLLNLWQEDLNSKYSSYTGKKILVAFEEIATSSWVKDIKISNKLKNFIMAPKIQVDEKYGKKYEIENTAMFIINSNSDKPIYLDSSEKWNRRYSVFKSNKPLDKKSAIKINKVVRDKNKVSSYIAWLKKTFPEVLDMKEFVAMENKDKEELINKCRDLSNEFWDYYLEKWYSRGRILVTTINSLFSDFVIEYGTDLTSFKKTFWSNSKYKKQRLQYPWTKSPRWLVEIPEEPTIEDVREIFHGTLESVEDL